MNRPFSSYNVKAHNRMLGQLRSEKAKRRNDDVLRQLRALSVIPSKRNELYAALRTHSGKLPFSVLIKLAKQVRKEKTEV